jgi:hypothetical protein
LTSLPETNACNATCALARSPICVRGDLAKFATWVNGQSNFRLLEVDYNAMVVDPEPIVDEIDQFLGGGLDVAAMSSAVDPRLYRSRAN